MTILGTHSVTITSQSLSIVNALTVLAFTLAKTYSLKVEAKGLNINLPVAKLLYRDGTSL